MTRRPAGTTRSTRPAGGTCRFGTDLATAVLDVNCKAHDVDNLYVVDTSFLPGIGAVHPALTAMANAIRVGEHLAERRCQPGGRPPGTRCHSLVRRGTPSAQTTSAASNSPRRVTTPSLPGGTVGRMRAGLAGAVLVTAGALLGAGCSSGGSGSAAGSASPSASAAVCADVAALRSSVAEVGRLTPNAQALGKLKTDMARIGANLATLRAEASSEWHAQIDALSSSLSTLQKTLTNLGSQSSPVTAAKAVSTDLAAVTTDASDLLRAASTRCPSASASPTG